MARASGVVLQYGIVTPGGEMPEPQKEYRARIWVKLTDELLPSPLLSKEQLASLLKEALRPGEADSPVAGVVVEDPRR